MADEQYISWPGENLFPGDDEYPGWSPSVVDGTKRVLAHNGRAWKLVEDERLSAIAALGAASVEAAGNRTIDLSQITTTGNMRNETAQTIGALSGQFVQLATHQLVVSGTASIDTAVVREIWSRVVHAERGEFDQITANMISVGAIDGQVVTGATIQTAMSGPRVVMDEQGISAFDDNRARVTITTEGITVNDASGDRTLYADSAGDMVLAGNINIEDSWSAVQIGDLPDPYPSYRWGVGMKWTRKDGLSRTPGGVGIFFNANESVAGIMLQSPSTATAVQSSIRLTDSQFMLHVGGNNFFSYNTAGSFGLFAGGGTYITGGYIQGAGSRELSLNRTASHSVFLGNSGRTFCNGEGLQINGLLHTTGAKTFMMPHPLREGEALFHACSESPWDGIEYWGSVVVGPDGTAGVELPGYVEAIRRHDAPVSIQATGHRAPAHVPERSAGTSFTIKGEPGDTVDWLWKGARNVPGGNTVPEGLPYTETDRQDG